MLGFLRDSVRSFEIAMDAHRLETLTALVLGRIGELDPRKDHQGTVPSLQAVARTAWGMDELYVIDPDGNLIKFGQESPAE